jgi:predicted nucleotidyltransferase
MDMAENKLHEEKYVKIAREIVLRNIEKDRYHVFLFGSRADESCNYGSDIDIGILGEQPLGKLYYKIINELDNSIIPYKIEIVDFSLVSEEFKNMVLKGRIHVWNLGKYFDLNSIHINKR